MLLLFLGPQNQMCCVSKAFNIVHENLISFLQIRISCSGAEIQDVLRRNGAGKQRYDGIFLYSAQQKHKSMLFFLMEIQFEYITGVVRLHLLTNNIYDDDATDASNENMNNTLMNTLMTMMHL